MQCVEMVRIEVKNSKPDDGFTPQLSNLMNSSSGTGSQWECDTIYNAFGNGIKRISAAGSKARVTDLPLNTWDLSPDPGGPEGADENVFSPCGGPPASFLPHAGSCFCPPVDHWVYRSQDGPGSFLPPAGCLLAVKNRTRKFPDQS